MWHRHSYHGAVSCPKRVGHASQTLNRMYFKEFVTYPRVVIHFNVPCPYNIGVNQHGTHLIMLMRKT